MAVHEVKTHGSSSSSGQRSTTEIYKLFSKDHGKKKQALVAAVVFSSSGLGGVGVLWKVQTKKGVTLMLD